MGKLAEQLKMEKREEVRKGFYEVMKDPRKQRLAEYEFTLEKTVRMLISHFVLERLSTDDLTSQLHSAIIYWADESKEMEKLYNEIYDEEKKS
jgi:hypothetical protein